MTNANHAHPAGTGEPATNDGAAEIGRSLMAAQRIADQIIADAEFRAAALLQPSGGEIGGIGHIASDAVEKLSQLNARLERSQSELHALIDARLADLDQADPMGQRSTDRSLPAAGFGCSVLDQDVAPGFKDAPVFKDAPRPWARPQALAAPQEVDSVPAVASRNPRPRWVADLMTIVIALALLFFALGIVSYR